MSALPSRRLLLLSVGIAQVIVPAVIFGCLFFAVIASSHSTSASVLANAASTIFEAIALSIPTAPASFAISALVGLPIAAVLSRSHKQPLVILWLSLFASHIAAAASIAFLAWAVFHKLLFDTLVPYAALVGCVVATVAIWFAGLTTYMDASRK